jgi:hypothetical protein
MRLIFALAFLVFVLLWFGLAHADTFGQPRHHHHHNVASWHRVNGHSPTLGCGWWAHGRAGRAWITTACHP